MVVHTTLEIWFPTILMMIRFSIFFVYYVLESTTFPHFLRRIQILRVIRAELASSWENLGPDPVASNMGPAVAPVEEARDGFSMLDISKSRWLKALKATAEVAGRFATWRG